MEGTPFGRYRLQDMLGRGGMGEVWRAYDTETARVVAVKVLPQHLIDDPEFEQRFRREAEMAAGLNDPHVVPIHHFGEIDGRLYVDMRLIEGRSLEAVLRDGPLEPSRAVQIIEQVASALQDAHKVGLVHRDVKPSNIMVDDDDFAYLIDFGIARSAGEPGMTHHGEWIGTAEYMAPERFDKGHIDTRSDVYALACVLYQALTGRPPYAGEAVQQMAGHMTKPPPKPSMLRNTVPSTLDTVVATGMAKNPEARYPTAKDLAKAARAALSHSQPPTRPTPPARRPHFPQRLPRPHWPSPSHPAPPTWRAPTPTPVPPGYPHNLPGYPNYPPRPASPPRPPWWKRNILAIVAAVACFVLVAVVIGVVLGNSGGGPPPVTNPPDPPIAEPPNLDSLLLKPDQLNRITGLTDLHVSNRGTEPLYEVDITPPDCHAVWYFRGQEYAGKYKNMRWQELQSQAGTFVAQIVAQFESPAKADEFVEAWTPSWQACQGTLVKSKNTKTNATGRWNIGEVTVRPDSLSAMYYNADNAALTCQHVLESVSLIVVEVNACGADYSDQGSTIASTIADKVGD